MSKPRRSFGNLALAAVLVMALSLPLVANAVQQWCEGTIVGVYVADDGTVLARPSWRNDWLAYCNLNAARGAVSPKVCSSWLAELLLAYQANRATTTYYGDAGACPTLATYTAAPVPSYFMVR